MDNFINGILKIHEALIQRGGPKPRNIIVVKDHLKRVIWIELRPSRNLRRKPDYKRREVSRKKKEEEETVVYFENFIVSTRTSEVSFIISSNTAQEANCAERKLDKAYLFYCT